MKKSFENTNNTKKFFIRAPHKFTLKSAFIISVIFVVILALGYGSVMFFSKNTAKAEGKSVYCAENGKIDYEVAITKNQEGLPNILESNMSYVSSLINTVNLKFSYDLFYDRSLEHGSKYKILADFFIVDKKSASENGDNVLMSFTDEIYSAERYVETSDRISLTKEISIPYRKYNKLAEEFSEKNNIDIDSYVNVRIVINTDGKSENIDSMDRKTEFYLKIPLCSKTIDIDETHSKVNESFVFDAYIPNVRNISLGIVCLILAVTIIAMECAIISAYIPKYKDYYKKLNSIFRNYSHIIVKIARSEESFEKMINEEIPVRYVKNFEDLALLSGILHEPIKCCSERDENIVYFILDNANFERYIYVMQNDDE
ncbi:MAG: DUF5305 family protein [Clostridia bacterium]|nr:DUF5305 family protein [Clostridia bacterium]